MTPTTERYHLPATPTRLPAAVYVVAFATFSMATSEFILAGILGRVAESLQVSTQRAGMLVSFFAVGMIVGAPLMAWVGDRGTIQRVAGLSMAVFATIHVAMFWVTDFTVLAVLRVLSALAAAMVWSIGSAYIMRIVHPDAAGRAMSVLIAGPTLAALVGVPLGTVVADLFGWRASFVLIGGLCALVTIAVWSLPREGPPAEATVTSGPPAWLILRRSFPELSVIVLTQIALCSTYTYVTVIGREEGGLSEDQLAPLVFVYGVGALVGVLAAVRFRRRHRQSDFAAGVALMGVAAILVWATLGLGLMFLVPLAVFAASGYFIGGPLNSAAFHAVGASTAMVAALTVSAFNVGNMVGPLLGGWVAAEQGWGAVPLLSGAIAVSSLLLILLPGWRVRHG